jgi:hypothetical protein
MLHQQLHRLTLAISLLRCSLVYLPAVGWQLQGGCS